MITYFIPQERIASYRKEFINGLTSQDSRETHKFVFSNLDSVADPYSDRIQLNQVGPRERYLRFRIGRKKLYLLLKAFNQNTTEFFIFEYSLKYLPTILICFFRRRHYLLWGHGKDYTLARARSKTEMRIKNFILDHSSFFLAYTETCATHLALLGYPESRIAILNNSTDTETILSLVKKIGKEEISQFKIRNNVYTDLNFLSVGSLIPERNLQFLFESLALIQDQIPEFTLWIAGDGPETSSLQKIAPKNVRFLGHIDQFEIALIAKICTAILNPGRVGLIAVDSFALDLPIIAVDWHLNAPEFSYLKNGYNSIITRYRLEEFSEAIVRLVTSPPLLLELKRGCSESVKNFSSNNMVRNFKNGCSNFESLLGISDEI